MVQTSIPIAVRTRATHVSKYAQLLCSGGFQWSQGCWWPSTCGTRLLEPVASEAAGSQGGSWEDGQLGEAIETLDLLVEEGAHIPASLFYRVFKGCCAKKDLILGCRVHALTLTSGYASNTYLANHIIRMYVSHGRLQDATEVFHKVAAPDSFTWASIILAYAKHGQAKQAIELYQQIPQLSVKLDNHVFVAVLKACASAAALAAGKEVHADVLGSSLEPNIFVGNCLVDMYAKCRRLQDARNVFDSLHARDVVTWNAMLAGYAQNGFGQEALALYARMQQEGNTEANSVTFVCLLKACAAVGALYDGQQLHSEIQERGLEADVFVGNCLVDMYAKCGTIQEARRVFDRLPTKDAVTWNTMIAGYSQRGLGQEALSLYGSMRQGGGAAADPFTFVCLLKACASIGALPTGKQLHCQIEERGLEADVVVGGSLVDMYAKCGSLEDARRVFDRLPTRDVVTWNSMLTGYAQRELGEEVMSLYKGMRQEGISSAADQVTFVCLLKACASVGAPHEGKQLHAEIQERGLDRDVVVGNSLVDMYAKCGSISDAQGVFDRLPERDVVTWTALILGYAQQECCQEALCLYDRMQREGLAPANHVTFVCLLRACASTGALKQGKSLHSQIKELGVEAEVAVGSSLVDMYAKCGSLEDARGVFDRLPTKNVVTWNALMHGYGQHNRAEMALGCFQEMQEQGVEPNANTFVCLLAACSHAGLLCQGQLYFKAMTEDHGIAPGVDHYVCMVDLLGRSGQLDDAERVVVSMPFEDEIVAWSCLLSACKRHNDVERGRRCFENIVRVEPQNAAAYTILGAIYADAGRWEDVARVERLRKLAGACKKPAKAWIEVNNKVETFVVGEEQDDISRKLKSVNALARQEGASAGREGDEEEDGLCGHAEKLALAYGLLNTPDGTILLVTKNLRMCNACHSGTKMMSRLERREIIVRDAHRLHRFVNGVCSCGDLQ